MTYIVALTGGIGSGKTTISNSFKKIGINIIDTDIIGKKIIEKNIKIFHSIKKKFGNNILNSNQSINRKLLRKYIFNDKQNKLWLENMLIPEIYKESKKQIRSSNSIWCLWVVPLLIEKKLDKIADRILVVDTPVKTQIKRIMIRDEISLYQAQKIIYQQTDRKKRILIADDIILNNNKNMRMLDIYVHYLNYFYTYLFNKYKRKNYKKSIFKKNYLTKLY
ncbi:dephospho-CoA kinase [Buchnera aphidicola (Aphis glycines)]|uniref:Dephospho-CoA kinase n=1 Tax=Buchnera aphidicola (Aphis glycines) TaxID=1265350 RepID=A0A0M4H3D6_9GAMM|nr:dephospho-CoA kinase [Buchnera aphidicola]ALD15163.1 dephospho-CoA kinase [Buchnera aphidicola (Aphis glycines)]